MLSVLFLVVLVAVAPSSPFGGKDSLWKAWKSFHAKKYTTEREEGQRRAIWRNNLEIIKAHNAGKHSYTLAMNQFGDLNATEFKYRLGYRASNSTGGSIFMPPSNVVPPATVNWTTEGYVTPVKEQKKCGSCWAFSTTGSLEGQHFKNTGKLVSLSEQNLVDCSTSYDNSGCEGGDMENAFNYIKANGGIDTEASYPYEAEDGSCRFKESGDAGFNVTGYIYVESGSEEALRQAVATVGPISVAIDADSLTQFYKTGVYDELNCSSTNTELNHAVLAVGYGTYEGKDYWLVKNSWGTGWGMDGYIMMSRNKSNQCGIATRAIYPVVVSNLVVTEASTTPLTTTKAPSSLMCFDMRLIILIFINLLTFQFNVQQFAVRK